MFTITAKDGTKISINKESICHVTQSEKCISVMYTNELQQFTSSDFYHDELRRLAIYLAGPENLASWFNNRSNET